MIFSRLRWEYDKVLVKGDNLAMQRQILPTSRIILHVQLLIFADDFMFWFPSEELAQKKGITTNEGNKLT